MHHKPRTEERPARIEMSGGSARPRREHRRSIMTMDLEDATVEQSKTRQRKNKEYEKHGKQDDQQNSDLNLDQEPLNDELAGGICARPVRQRHRSERTMDKEDVMAQRKVAQPDSFF